MNSLVYNKIIDVLKLKLEVSEFANEYWQEEELGLGEIQEVQRYGGEGKGELWYVVYYFVKYNVYIRIDGFYSSYNGVDFGDWDEACKEVKPEVRQVTFYE